MKTKKFIMKRKPVFDKNKQILTSEIDAADVSNLQEVIDIFKSKLGIQDISLNNVKIEFSDVGWEDIKFIFRYEYLESDESYDNRKQKYLKDLEKYNQWCNENQSLIKERYLNNKKKLQSRKNDLQKELKIVEEKLKTA